MLRRQWSRRHTRCDPETSCRLWPSRFLVNAPAKSLLHLVIYFLTAVQANNVQDGDNTHRHHHDRWSHRDHEQSIHVYTSKVYTSTRYTTTTNFLLLTSFPIWMFDGKNERKLISASRDGDGKPLNRMHPTQHVVVLLTHPQHQTQNQQTLHYPLTTNDLQDYKRSKWILLTSSNCHHVIW